MPSASTSGTIGLQQKVDPISRGAAVSRPPRGSRPAIPPQRHEAPLACSAWICHHRNRVERLWARLKEWRAIATHYETTATSFIGVLRLAASLDWLKN